jgi:hypothetical protein
MVRTLVIDGVKAGRQWGRARARPFDRLLRTAEARVRIS